MLSKNINPHSANSSLKKSLIIQMFLILSILIAYRQVPDFGFVNYDDNIYVFENEYVQKGLTKESIRWAFTAKVYGHWNPFVRLSFMADYELFGLNPRGFHLTNIVLHIINALLLYMLLNNLTSSIWRSAIVSSLFALHPLHVESVAWVTERKDLLSTLFFFLTLLAYSFYVKRGKLLRYLTVISLFIMSLLSKPMLVTLPFVLLLIDYWPLKRFDVKIGGDKGKVILKLLIEKIPFIVLSVIFSIITIFLHKRMDALATSEILPFGLRAANAIVSYMTYIIKMFFPVNLAVFYPHPGNTLTVAEIVTATVLFITLSIFAFTIARRHPYAITGWLWYTGTLFPVIGLLQAGSYAMADRYTYIPLTGLFIMISWGGAEIKERMKVPNKVLIIPVTIIVLLLMYGTWLQTSYWKDTETLFRRSVEVNPDNLMMHRNLALHYSEKGELKKAEMHYLEVLRIKPDYAEGYNNLGGVYAGMADYEKAFAGYTKAIEIDPGYAEAYNNIGAMLVRGGMLREAESMFKKALSLQPDYIEAYNNMGILLFKKGKINDSARYFKKALQINPEYKEAAGNLEKIEKMKEVNR